MELTVLGCGTPYPRPGEPCSGYLVSEGDTRVMLDCGPGTFAALQEHLRPGDLSALWISHLHPDHFADVLSFCNWALNTADAPRLAVHGPEGWAGRLEAVLGADVSSIFEVREHVDGRAVEVGGLRLVSRAVRHSVPAFGVRVEGRDSVLCYSGDTAPCAALVEAADRADLFLCEAGSAVEADAHSTPEQAYDLARAARVRALVFTHLAPGLDPRRVDAARYPDLPTSVARPTRPGHTGGSTLAR
ncbi:MBL fold metallo-hydrolase [Saccharothrix violaceirubra]|uniref:Ribonuclease BN (tRNA processing enzyme) n=1 Tax=Saccharothrix violaceirubra TaxID=413306 RepID=A0A7W7WVE5_9PSEU|nr:MBL fold metallo-hydrolase [Saccharothrix violaceirubra]MBB4964966.1 ribonuclease BN (tRNA processing enzyme) [Saccharothrix violaceirubra]